MTVRRVPAGTFNGAVLAPYWRGERGRTMRALAVRRQDPVQLGPGGHKPRGIRSQLHNV